jgi:hypothetical protein
MHAMKYIQISASVVRDGEYLYFAPPECGLQVFGIAFQAGLALG